MIYTYIILSAALMFLLNVPLGIFTSSWSWWAVPLIFVGTFLCFILLHCLILCIAIITENTKKDSRDTDLFRFWVNGFLEIAFKFGGVKIHSTGLDKVPQDEPFLLVCNHIHDLDPAIIYHEIPDARIAFVGKKDIEQQMPFIYKALHKLGGLPIDRENNREAAKTIINAVNRIKDGKNSIGIFPEGYTSRDGEFHEFRNGAFKIATKTQCKTVVCTVVGTRNILKNLFKRKTDIYFDVIDVVDAAGVKQTAELSEHIHTLMADNLNKYKS